MLAVCVVVFQQSGVFNDVVINVNTVNHVCYGTLL